VLDPDAQPRPFGLAEDVPALDSEVHAHRRAQLLYAVSGALQLRSGGQVIGLPPTRAAWIPGGLPHQAGCGRPVKLRTVWLDQALGDPGFSVFEAPPLLAELVGEICALGTTPPPEASPLFDALRYLVTGWARSPLPLQLPLPASDALRRVTDRVLRRPGAPLTVADAAATAHLSPRTLQRRFRAELGMGFADWLTRARLLHATDRLADPQLDIGEVALSCGYASPTAFARAFRRHLGRSPTDWRRERPPLR